MATFRTDNLICVRNGMILRSSESIVHSISWHHMASFFGPAIGQRSQTKTVDMSTGAPWETLTLTALSSGILGKTRKRRAWSNTPRLRPNVFHEILAEAKEAMVCWFWLGFGWVFANSCHVSIWICAFVGCLYLIEFYYFIANGMEYRSLCVPTSGRQPWLVKKAWQSSISTCPSGFL